MQLASYLQAHLTHLNALSYFYTINIILAAHFNIYDRHNNKHCARNKLNYKT